MGKAVDKDPGSSVRPKDDASDQWAHLTDAKFQSISFAQYLAQLWTNEL